MIDLLHGWWPRDDARFETAAVDDAAAFSALHAESFRRGWSEHEFEQLLLEQNVIADRAVLGGHLAGFILSRRAADEAEVLSVVVAAALRGRRVGARLLAVHLDRLVAQEVVRLFLEVDADNTAACRLYGAAGFREVGQRPAYYDRGGGKPATALVLRRDLA